MKTKLSDEVIEIGKLTGNVIAALLCTDGEWRTATKYLDPKFVIKATHGRRPNNRDRSQSLIVSFGRPNYQEAKFVKLCKRAGELFPVRKVQLKAWPKKRPRKLSSLSPYSVGPQFSLDHHGGATASAVMRGGKVTAINLVSGPRP